MSKERDSLDRLLDIMAELRHPETGCLWDRQQTFESIIPYTLEEAYELADAILNGDREDIKQESGDLLFQVVFYAQLAKEEGAFDFDDVLKAIADKLIRRHPHVFSNTPNKTLNELQIQWEVIKQQEKGAQATGIFADVPEGLPSLKLAHKLQNKCAQVGFDWNSPLAVLEKVKEEMVEIEEAMSYKDTSKIEEEIGDAFFALVNLARHYDIDAELAIRKANHKFRHRFEWVENHLCSDGKKITSYSIDELESAWRAAKRAEG